MGCQKSHIRTKESEAKKIVVFFDKHDKKKKRVPVKALPLRHSKHREISDGIPSMEPSYGVEVEDTHFRGYSHQEPL